MAGLGSPGTGSKISMGKVAVFIEQIHNHARGITTRQVEPAAIPRAFPLNVEHFVTFRTIVDMFHDMFHDMSVH